MTLDIVLFAWLVVFASIGALVVLMCIIGAFIFVLDTIKWYRWEKRNERIR